MKHIIEKVYSSLTKGLDRDATIVLLGIFYFTLVAGIVLFPLYILDSKGVISFVENASLPFYVFHYLLTGLLIISSGVFIAVLHRHLRYV